MTTADVREVAADLGFDELGVARAEAYEATERHIRERRERGLFAGMKFTMAQPETSCHPETLLPGARSVVTAARCYWQPEAPLAPGHGRLARYTWDDAYAHLRGSSTSSAGASAAPIACSSTQTSTSIVKQRPAAASASTARTRC